MNFMSARSQTRRLARYSSTEAVAPSQNPIDEAPHWADRPADEKQDEKVDDAIGYCETDDVGDLVGLTITPGTRAALQKHDQKKCILSSSVCSEITIDAALEDIGYPDVREDDAFNPEEMIALKMKVAELQTDLQREHSRAKKFESLAAAVQERKMSLELEKEELQEKLQAVEKVLVISAETEEKLHERINSLVKEADGMATQIVRLQRENSRLKESAQEAAVTKASKQGSRNCAGHDEPEHEEKREDTGNNPLTRECQIHRRRSHRSNYDGSHQFPQEGSCDEHIPAVKSSTLPNQQMIDESCGVDELTKALEALSRNSSSDSDHDEELSLESWAAADIINKQNEIYNNRQKELLAKTMQYEENSETFVTSVTVQEKKRSSFVGQFFRSFSFSNISLASVDLLKGDESYQSDDYGNIHDDDYSRSGSLASAPALLEML